MSRMTYMRSWKSLRLTSHTRLGLNPQIGRPLSRIVVPLVYFLKWTNLAKVIIKKYFTQPWFLTFLRMSDFDKLFLHLLLWIFLIQITKKFGFWRKLANRRSWTLQKERTQFCRPKIFNFYILYRPKKFGASFSLSQDLHIAQTVALKFFANNTYLFEIYNIFRMVHWQSVCNLYVSCLPNIGVDTQLYIEPDLTSFWTRLFNQIQQIFSKFTPFYRIINHF
jgi:hypothetical protein